MARYDDLNTNAIAYATFLSCVLLIVIILLVQALCFNWLENREEERVAKESYVAADENIAAQRASLDGYKWAEVPAPPVPGEQPPKAGDPIKMIKKLHIPFDRAKDLLLNDLKAVHHAPKT